jgi:hypothetical protein
MFRDGCALSVDTTGASDEVHAAAALLSLICLIDIHPFSKPSKWVKVREGCDGKLRAFCVLVHPMALTALATDTKAAEFLEQMKSSWKLFDRKVPLIAS